jgi:CBS domain-containing protein
MMSEAGDKVKAKDVMSAPVITVDDSESSARVSELMVEHNIGSIIVVNRKKNPLGIITERDIVKRVAAKNLLPAKVKASEIMSKPLMTIDSVTGITDAMRRMRASRIERLGVIEKGKLAGIVSSSDILRITPALIDIASEKSLIGAVPERERVGLTGYCDQCGSWSENLKQGDGKFLCDDCVSDLEEEKKRH